MVANNYLNENRPHTEVIELMVLGFIGKLLQWWNNYLTEESKEDVKHAVQKDEEGLPIFDECIGKGILDGVNTLIYTIMKHFVGKPSNITARIYDQLSNLRCQTLGDYRWYEDVFTTIVMHRSDCNSPFWKEKFINGLLRLFGEKVKTTLCSPLGVIDYDNLTYGDISSTIRSEGMKMCRDMKIQSQASKSKAKYEVGNFYTQYGLPPIAPSKRKSREVGKDYSGRFSGKKTASKYYGSQKKSSHDFYKKGKKSKDYHKVNGKRKDSTQKASNKGECYKCGKKGHYRNKCRSKAKTLIHTLVSDQTGKEEILKLLELDHSESESSRSSRDQEFYQLNQLSSPRASLNTSSGPDASIACKDGCCRNKSINVLSTQEELLLDLIEQIEDPVIKAQYLSKFHKAEA